MAPDDQRFLIPLGAASSEGRVFLVNNFIEELRRVVPDQGAGAPDPKSPQIRQEGPMQSLSDSDARRRIVERIRELTPEHPRMWGRMDHSQMLAHVADQLRMAVGDIPAGKPSGPLRFALPRYLVIHVLPWPKGRAKGPKEAFTTVPTDWERDRAALLELIERFAATPPSGLQGVHPLFGRLTERDWGVLSHRHLDHHLRQFSA